MHYQVAVEIADRGAYFQEQSDSGPDAETGGIHIDRLPLDVFHRQVRLAIPAVTGVQQSRDIRMRQRRQNLPFGKKPLAERRIVGTGTQQFHGHTLRYFTVDTFGKVYGAHPAASQEVSQAVWPAGQVLLLAPRQGSYRRAPDLPVQRRCGVLIERQQDLDLGPATHFDMLFREIAGAGVRGQVSHRMEDLLDLNSHGTVHLLNA